MDRVPIPPYVTEIKSRLEDAFGPRLKGVLLYGSEARGKATAESDVDLLVLLDGPIAFGAELETIIRWTYPIQLEIERPVHAIPVDAEAYERGEFALYRNAKREGILV